MMRSHNSIRAAIGGTPKLFSLHCVSSGALSFQP